MELCQAILKLLLNIVFFGKQRSPLEWILTIVAVCVGWWSSNTIFHYFQKVDKPFDQVLMEASEENNKSLPKMFDAITRLDSTSFDAQKKWHYHFTIVGLSEEKLHGKTLKDVIDVLRPKIRESYRTGSLLSMFREHGITINYDYYDSSGKFIDTVEVGPADLKP